MYVHPSGRDVSTYTSASKIFHTSHWHPIKLTSGHCSQSCAGSSPAFPPAKQCARHQPGRRDMQTDHSSPPRWKCKAVVPPCLRTQLKTHYLNNAVHLWKKNHNTALPGHGINPMWRCGTENQSLWLPADAGKIQVIFSFFFIFSLLNKVYRDFRCGQIWSS